MLREIDSDFRVDKANRREVQIADRGRQILHFPELLLDRTAARKDLERKQHLAERRIRKKNQR